MDEGAWRKKKKTASGAVSSSCPGAGERSRTLDVTRAQLTAQLQIAQMDGNDAAALDIRIRLKQLEIDVITAKVAATRLEAQATLASADATRAALLAEGKLTEAKKLEIDASIANAKVKLLEADASGASLELLRRQIENLRLYGDEAGRARDKSAKALRGESDALRENSDALDRNLQLTNEITAAKARQDAINHQSADNTGLASLQAKKRAGTLTADDLATAQGVYSAASANLQQYQPNSIYYSAEGAKSVNQDYNAARLILAAVQELAKPQSAAGAVSATQTLKIELGGKTTAIGLASSNDRDALQAILRELAAAKSATGTT